MTTNKEDGRSSRSTSSSYMDGSLNGNDNSTTASNNHQWRIPPPSLLLFPVFPEINGPSYQHQRIDLKIILEDVLRIVDSNVEYVDDNDRTAAPPPPPSFSTAAAGTTAIADSSQRQPSSSWQYTNQESATKNNNKGCDDDRTKPK